MWNNDVAINQVHVAKHWIIDCVKQVIYYCTPRSGSTGEYSVLSFCIGPPYGRANTASLEPTILLYCPPIHAIIYIYSPDLMPIEELLSKVKSSMKALESEHQTGIDLETIMLAAFSTVTDDICQQWISHAGIII